MGNNVGNYRGTGGLSGLVHFTIGRTGSEVDIERSAIQGQIRATRQRVSDILDNLETAGEIQRVQLGKSATDVLANLDAAEPLIDIPVALRELTTDLYFLGRLGYWNQAAFRLRQIWTEYYRNRPQ